MTTGDRKARKAAEAEARQREAQERRLALEAKKEARIVARFEREFWASPVGQARAAKLAGDKYFQVEIPLDSTVHSPDLVIDISVTRRTQGGQGRTLTEIEYEGWELINAGFVFKETGQISRDKFLSSGQQVNTTGETWGVYLFRATNAPAQTDEVWLTWAANQATTESPAATSTPVDQAATPDS